MSEQVRYNRVTIKIPQKGDSEITPTGVFTIEGLGDVVNICNEIAKRIGQSRATKLFYAEVELPIIEDAR